MRVKFKSAPKNEIFHLTIDQTYVVYGLEYYAESRIRFLLVNDSNTYPNFFLSQFFEVVDDRISKYWVGYPKDTFSPSCAPLNVVVSFIEAQKPFFFDNLLDDEKEATQAFKTMTEKMDVEFPDTTIKTASVIDKNWITCSYCDEVWEISPEDGIVTCPNGHANNNPLWQRH